ncbi:MAG: sugar ABC transporter permease [Actinomycetia bacterium]|nr:sugar ABC transporter permease [Actinomycetes bacterium]MCL2730425.1 sugar ABC transporter permease [Actinomycetes bacterium]
MAAAAAGSTVERPGRGRARPGGGAAGTAPSGSPRRRRTNGAAYTLLSPWLLGTVGVLAIPLLYSLYLSFTSYDLLSNPHWVGFRNYRRLFSDDPRYAHSMWVTLQYVITSAPLKLLMALAVALLLARPRRGQGAYRALFYLPSLLGTSVAIAIVWQGTFEQNGPFNGFLKLFGVHGQAWVSDPSYVRWVIVALAMWQFGAPMVIFLAGLKQIPQELYEAAEMDGAGWWRRFFSITLPMLSPVILFNLVVEMIGAFQAFTPAQLVGDGQGGPVDSTLFYTLYLYQRAFQMQQMGYAAAMAWVMIAGLGLITALLFWSSRYWVHYGD